MHHQEGSTSWGSSHPGCTSPDRGKVWLSDRFYMRMTNKSNSLWSDTHLKPRFLYSRLQKSKKVASLSSVKCTIWMKEGINMEEWAWKWNIWRNTGLETFSGSYLLWASPLWIHLHGGLLHSSTPHVGSCSSFPWAHRPPQCGPDPFCWGFPQRLSQT